jgi:hypothetical protein
VLLQFGEAIRVSEWLGEMATNRKAAIQRFSEVIEQRIQSLILHLPDLAEARMVRAVAGLYLDRLRSEERRTWCVGMAHWIWGWPGSVLYGLSLPLAGLFAHGYARQAVHYPARMRRILLQFRAPWAMRRLLREREFLIREIERARVESQDLE